jgi:hypothetical protein
MTTYGAEQVRLRLDTMRKDARERVGREIARLLSTAGNNGALGTRFESATTAFYCATVNAAARVLLNVRGDCDALDPSPRNSLPISSLNWRGGAG